MTLKQALAALKKGGTAQNRKIYGRHGVSGEMYGVSYALQKKLAKQAGNDHELAVALWATGNHDARVLATMVCDPTAFSSRELDAMARDLDSYVLADAFSSVVSRSGKAIQKYGAWKNRKAEHISSAAWNVLASQAFHDDSLTDEFCAEQIDLIAREIHSRPNRTRHSMNQALISLGVRNPRLEKKARAAAKKIGKVEVDHGQTSCQTPDAAAYMTKTLEHRKKQAAKKSAKKATRKAAK
jgi:3-methyladenine DNA glycosylase AlkD